MVLKLVKILKLLKLLKVMLSLEVISTDNFASVQTSTYSEISFGAKTSNITAFRGKCMFSFLLHTPFFQSVYFISFPLERSKTKNKHMSTIFGSK